jgi:hypothetical protein
MNIQKSPLELLNERLDEVMKREDSIGSCVVVGLPDDNDDDEDEQTSNENITEEQVSKIRHILITKEREKVINRMEKALLGDQYGDVIQCFNTTYSYEAMEFLNDQLRKLSGKPIADKFNRLFAMTYALWMTDYWMHDFEDKDYLNASLKKLSTAWKNALKEPNHKLKIDPEFTRPGIEALLHEFKTLLQSSGLLVFDTPY